jgi:hypothetical protein
VAAVLDSAGARLASTSNTTSYASNSFTPTQGDLLYVTCAASDTTVTTPTLTASANGITFTRVIGAVKAVGADSMFTYVANQLVGASPSAMTVTFDCTGDAATGCIIVVALVSGMTKTGSTAIKQSAKVDNVAGGTAPSTVFGASCDTNNPTIFSFMVTVAVGTTPPTNWTERTDLTYATPTQGGGYDSRDSGFTGTTITLGSTANGNCCAIAVELDASATAVARPPILHSTAIQRAANW